MEMTVKSAKDRLEKRGEIYLDAEPTFATRTISRSSFPKAGAASLKSPASPTPPRTSWTRRFGPAGRSSSCKTFPRIDVNDAKQIEIVKSGDGK